MRTILLQVSIKEIADYGALVVLAGIAIIVLLQTFRRNNKFQDEEIKDFKAGLDAINDTLKEQHSERKQREDEWHSERLQGIREVGGDLKEIKDGLSDMHDVLTLTVGRVDRLERDQADIRRRLDGID